MAPVESSLHFPVLPLVGPMRLTTLWGASAPASPTKTKNLMAPAEEDVLASAASTASVLRLRDILQVST